MSALALACGAVHAQLVLPPVVVTATRFPEDADRLPFGVSVVTAEQIRNAGVTTVNEAVIRLLGVPGRQDLYGGGDYALDLRGFGTTADSNQAVIVDGVRLNEADLGGTRLAGIDIDSVETIEVIRGNASVLYGEGATGGAIVVTTKAASGKARHSSGRGYLAMGSDSLLDARAGATLINGGFSLDASLAKRATDGHRDNFRSSVEGRGLSAQWQGDWLRIGAQHAQDELATGLPGSLTAAQYAANPRQTLTPDDRAGISNQRNSVFSELTWGQWRIALDAGHRDKSLVYDTPFFDYAYNVEARNRGLRVRHTLPVGGFTNTVTAGVDRQDWRRAIVAGATAAQESKAVYVKDDLALPGGTRLSAGVRRESALKTNTSASGSVDERFTAWDAGLVQPLWRAASAYVRGGRSFRFANVDEFGFISPGASLRPQTSRDLDLGLRVGWQGGRGELRFYRNALRDEIGYDPAAPGPFPPFPGANVNFDPTLRQGLELEAQQSVAQAVQVRVNAAARRARFTEGPYAGHNVALAPRYTASLGLDWQPLKGHRLNTLVNAVSSQSPDFENSCTMPAYTTVGLRYAFSTDNVELGLGVNNLTDRKYYTQAYGCAAGVPTSIYPEAGRNVVLSVRVTL